MGINENSKNWISKDLLYTQTSRGGFGMIRLEDFMKAIKVSWIKDLWVSLLGRAYERASRQVREY